MSLVVNEMGLLDSILFLSAYIVPVAVPLLILYKLDLRITSEFVIFAFVLSFVVGIIIDVILPLHFNLSLNSVLKAIDLSFLSTDQRLAILKFIRVLTYTLVNSIVLIPIGMLKLGREI
jgi:hypothetical protein